MANTISRWWLAVVLLAVGCSARENAPSGEEASAKVGQNLAAATSAKPTPPCELLDDPATRQRLGSALEIKLGVQCGRAARSAQVGGVEPGAESRLRALAAASTGTDILVNDPTLDSGGSTQSETSVVAVGNIVCASWNDAGEGFGLNGFAGFGYSQDGGQTFTDGGFFPAGPNGDQSFGDPSLSYSVRDGAFYFASLSSAGLSLWRSLNGCSSFEYVGPIHSSGGDDKEMMAVDNTPTSPFYGRIYVGWTAFGFGGPDINVAAHSDDGGLTWSEAESFPGSGGNGQGVYPAVAPNGDVYMALVNRAFDIGGHQDQWLYRSVDGGETWTKQADIGTDQLQPEDDEDTMACGRQALKGDIRNLSSPQIVITPDTSAAAGYVIHAVYPYDSDGEGPDHSNVFYRTSTDGALTWSAEVRLNDDTTDTDQFYPALGVSESGVLVASWYDRRLDPDNMLFDRYVTSSTDGGLTWSANERVSDVSSDVAQTNPNFDGLATCYHGDYDQVAVSGNVGHMIWADDRRVTASGPNPDVYYDQIVINPSLGRVRGTHAAVSCSSNIGFTLSDQDIAGTGTHEIALTVSNGDAETLVLTEDPGQPGVFNGSMATSPNAVTANNGTLEVVDAAVITATYEDADDGSGNPAVATAQVRVDCAPPVLENVHVASLLGDSATIAATVSEPAVLGVEYGFSCGELTQSAVSLPSPAPSVTLSGLYPDFRYFFAVTATDGLGNAVRDDNGGNCYSFRTLALIFDYGFEPGIDGFVIDNGPSSGGGFGGGPSSGGAVGVGGGIAFGGSGNTGSGGAAGFGPGNAPGEAGVGGVSAEGGASSGGIGGGAGSGGGVNGTPSSNGLWHLSEACAAVRVGHSQPTVLFYGNETDCTFDNGFRNIGTVTSPPITLSDANFAAVEFNYFLGTEGGGFYDQASLEVSVDDGPFQVVASNFTNLTLPDPDEPPPYRTRPGAHAAGRYQLVVNSGRWQHENADLKPFLPAAGSAVIRLRFHFDSIDSVANGFAGFLVDDVRVLGVVPQQACSADADCDDGLFCTGAEVCDGGFCAHGLPVVCDAAEDGVPCTVAVCDESARGCVQQPDNARCDDGTFCNGLERCDAVSGCQPGTVPCTDTPTVGCMVSFCNESLTTCSLVPDSSLCDDGLFCTGFEYCDPVAGCQPGFPPCDDGINCTDNVCNETFDFCEFPANDGRCNDTLFCNGEETCDPSIGCRSSGPPCGAGETCDETANQCVPSCFTDTNQNHKAASRAYSKGKNFFALGSNDTLGRSTVVTSLEGSGTFWRHVPSCPAPPSIDSVNVTVTGSVATVSGTASDPNNDIARVQLTFYIHQAFPVTIDATGTTTFSGSLGLPDGFHLVLVQAFDRTGLASAPSYFFFQVLPPIPPEIDSVSVTVSGGKATVSGTAFDPNGDIDFIEVTIWQGDTLVASAVAEGLETFTATLPGLAAGSYSARAQAFDGAGLASALSDPVPFDVTTSCVKDTNSHHASAGRATQRKGAYYAVGSNDSLGHSGSTKTSLSGADQYWEKVTSCP